MVVAIGIGFYLTGDVETGPETGQETGEGSVSPQPTGRVLPTTFTAMTDYWTGWAELGDEPWNRPADYTIVNYYTTNEVFTDYFYVQGNKFKINFYVAGDYLEGHAMIFTYPKGTDINYVSAYSISTPNALATGTYEVDAGPGYFYFVVRTEYVDYWSIDVYE
jgi:hypothetical protein